MIPRLMRSMIKGCIASPNDMRAHHQDDRIIFFIGFDNPCRDFWGGPDVETMVVHHGEEMSTSRAQIMDAVAK